MMRNTEHKQLSFTRYIFLKLQYILFYADPGPTVQKYAEMRPCEGILTLPNWLLRCIIVYAHALVQVERVQTIQFKCLSEIT